MLCWTFWNFNKTVWGSGSGHSMLLKPQRVELGRSHPLWYARNEDYFSTSFAIPTFRRTAAPPDLPGSHIVQWSLKESQSWLTFPNPAGESIKREKFNLPQTNPSVKIHHFDLKSPRRTCRSWHSTWYVCKTLNGPRLFVNLAMEILKEFVAEIRQISVSVWVKWPKQNSSRQITDVHIWSEK